MPGNRVPVHVIRHLGNIEPKGQLTVKAGDIIESKRSEVGPSAFSQEIVVKSRSQELSGLLSTFCF